MKYKSGDGWDIGVAKGDEKVTAKIFIPHVMAVDSQRV